MRNGPKSTPLVLWSDRTGSTDELIEDELIEDELIEPDGSLRDGYIDVITDFIDGDGGKVCVIPDGEFICSAAIFI